MEYWSILKTSRHFVLILLYFFLTSTVSFANIFYQYPTCEFLFEKIIKKHTLILLSLLIIWKKKRTIRVQFYGMMTIVSITRFPSIRVSNKLNKSWWEKNFVLNISFEIWNMKKGSARKPVRTAIFLPTAFPLNHHYATIYTNKTLNSNKTFGELFF